MNVKTENDFGSVVISNEILSKIVGNAVINNCYGVVGMAYKSKKDGLVNLLKNDSITKGVDVKFEDEKLNINLRVILEYGVNIKAVSDNIIDNVKYIVESMTGFKVGKVVVVVEGVRVDK